MPDKASALFATDKELYDLMFSSRQRMTEAVLYELALDRRIFCSSKASRAELADYLSGLPHDLADVGALVAQAEPGTRSERTTSTVIKANISTEEIKGVLTEYMREVSGSERVTVPPRGTAVVTATVEYDEFDLSRTRLLQRQQRSAGLEFNVSEDEVTVRLPATNKGREIVANLIDKLEKQKKAPLVQDEIVISDLSSEKRTRFFLDLITGMDGYRTETVTRLKVSAEKSEPDEPSDEDELEGAEGASAKMLHLVEHVALNGANLLASPEYRQLSESGFFITSMTWIAAQNREPFDRVQFDASFEDGQAGTGFRYLARHSRRSTRNERYPQHFKIPSDLQKKELFALIEKTARHVLTQLRLGAASKA